MNDILDQLSRVLAERKALGDSDNSYVAQLHAKGLNKILEKVGEESTETIIAAKDAAVSGDVDAFVSETADLWFHSMIALSRLDTDVHAVLAELARRFGLSGLDEKALRKEEV